MAIQLNGEIKPLEAGQNRREIVRDAAKDRRIAETEGTAGFKNPGFNDKATLSSPKQKQVFNIIKILLKFLPGGL